MPLDPQDPLYQQFLYEWLNGSGGGQFAPGAPPPPVEVETDPGASVQAPGGAAAPATSLEHAVAGFKQLAFQRHPYRVLWALRSDGLLCGLTYRKDHEVFAWHRHPMPGATVEGIGVIPDGATGEDQLWLVVRRTVNGEVVRMVEVMTPTHTPESPTDTADFWHLDCALKYRGESVWLRLATEADEGLLQENGDDLRAQQDNPNAATTLSGLDHLEGEIVSVWADGARHPDCTVSDGAITLERPVETAIVGLYAPPYLQPLPLEAGQQIGTAQGKLKRVSRVIARVRDTIGIKAGRDIDHLIESPRINTGQVMGEGPTLYTGDIPMPLNTGHSGTGQFIISQDGGAPLTVLALMPQVDGEP